MSVAARREALTSSVNVGHGQRRMIDAAAIGLRANIFIAFAVLMPLNSFTLSAEGNRYEGNGNSGNVDSTCDRRADTREGWIEKFCLRFG